MHTNGNRLLLLALLLGLSAASFGQVNVLVSFGPPALPVYSQPLCPGAGYIWTPGYWAYDPNFADYYWVPGTWVLAPVGYLWTPPWWGWNGNAYLFHTGYWGPHVGFYGGIVYGYGYFGRGYEGGRWEGNRFYYNRAVNNVNVTNVRNVYYTNVTNVTNVNRVSYNGGNGGITARPSREEEAVARERHIAPVAAQTQHVQAARRDTQLRASVNQGKPSVAATGRPGALRGPQAVSAKSAGAPYQAPAHTANAPATYSHNNVPRTPASGGGNNVARPPAATNTMGSPAHTQSSYPQQQQHGYGKPQTQSQGTQSGMYQPQAGYGKQQEAPHAQSHVNTQQTQPHQQQMAQPHQQQMAEPHSNVQQQQHVSSQGHSGGAAPAGEPAHAPHH